MVNQDLLDYIEQQHRLNIDSEQVHSELAANGWSEQDIMKAFEELGYQYPASLSKRQNNRRRTAIISVTALIFIFAVSASAYAYYQYAFSSDKIIEKVTKNLDSLKSFSFHIDASLEMQAGKLLSENSLFPTPVDKSPDGISRSKITIDGKTDRNDKDNPKGQIELTLSSDAIPGEDSQIGLEIRNLGKLFFLRLAKAPNLGIINLSMFEKQWIEIDPEEIKKLADPNGLASSTKPELSAKQSEQLADTASKAIIIEKKLGGQKVDGPPFVVIA